ncbi:MAG: response regulator [Roseiflexus sp.]
MRSIILIIDDEPEHCDILARLLRAYGYDIIEATPSNAFDHASVRRPDLILCSLSLPGQHLWETVRRLHTLTAVPVLGSTVYTTLIKRSWTQAIGCVDYIEKPFDLDKLIERVTTLLSATPMAA